MGCGDELAGRSGDATTVFFSSHQLADVERIADDVVMLDRGKVVLDASMDDLRAHHRLVAIGFPSPPAGDLQMPGVVTAGVVALALWTAAQISRRSRLV